MKKSIYHSIPHMGGWVRQTLGTKELSNKQCYTLGYKWLTITIGDDDYDLQCHAVDDAIMPVNMVLGRDLLAQIAITIIGGVPQISKLVPKLPESAEIYCNPTLLLFALNNMYTQTELTV